MVLLLCKTQDLPEQHRLVFTSGCEVSCLMWVPGQTEPFGLVADKLNLGVWLAGLMKAAVLGAVENQDPAVNCECSNDVWVLRLVSGLVDLAGVIDLLRDLESDDGRLPSSTAIATNLATLFVIVGRVRRCGFRNLEFRNLEVVGLAFGCVGTDEQSVDSLVLVLDVLDIGEPLGG